MTGSQRFWDLALFDWDGTLFNSLALYYNSTKSIFEHFKLRPPSLEQYRTEISANYMEDFYWKNGVPRDISADELNRIRLEYFKQCGQKTRLHRWSRNVLFACFAAKIPIIIVSAETASVINQRLSKFNIAIFIREVIGDICGNKLSALKNVLKTTGTDPARTFLAEDSCDGIEAAHQVNIKSVGCTYGFHSPERIIATRPTFVVDTPRKIIGIIKHGRIF
ncbi:MAG: HAD hydrolase-like protein [bacterium]|nr:HAD hydrolase-like protein [bacterium]